MSDIDPSTRCVPCKTVDVFTDTPFRGNPVAVVLDATGLSAERMQQIANWTNLSETTFVVPVTATGADYHVRIFTPGTELPFAGHPTIGTAHALLEAGIVEATNGDLVQQCGAGLVRLRVVVSSENTRNIAFTLPPPVFSALSQAQCGELQAILHTALEGGTRPCLVDVGARWVVAMLPSARAVLEAEPDLARMTQMNIEGGHTGVVIFGRHGPDADSEIEVRAFAPAHGVDEDPVCGSGNGCVAAYIRHTGRTAEFGADFLATQGAALGRAGKLRLSIAPDAIEVGGSAVTCMDGVLRL